MKNDVAKVLGLIVLVLGMTTLITLGAGCKRQNTALGQPSTANKFVLKAVQVKNAPVVDGEIDDVWAKASEVTVPLKGQKEVEPREITFKAIYTSDSIYLLARYKDSTPLKVNQQWQFDGNKWQKGSYDDTLLLLWNISNSIVGFNDKGFDVINGKPSPSEDVYTFKIVQTDSERGDDFSRQKGDVWSWCMVPEYYYRAGDFVFTLDSSTPGKPKEIKVKHDYFEHKPWFKNSVTVNGEEKPKYMLKPGVKQTPWPYLDEVVEITDYSIFKKGDTLPPLIMNRGVTWGGSKDDVQGKGKWTNGIWTVEFGRKLNTGHDDDIQFKVDGEYLYTFAAMIRDDSKGYVYSLPITLEASR